MKSVAIKSSSSDNELQLSKPEETLHAGGSEHYRVTLKAESLIASARIYAYEPHGKLSQFFENLAAHASGWNGEKQWSSLEGEFTLSCTHRHGHPDNVGYVSMEVTLKSGHYEDDWRVQILIHVDAGQLAEIAVNIKQFFSATDADGGIIRDDRE